jgi:outer membrane biosynthesis protein TonB
MNKEPISNETVGPKAATGVVGASNPKPAQGWQIEGSDADENRGSAKRKIIIGAVLLAAVGGVILVAKNFSGGSAAPQQREQNTTIFQLPPPPPPPPPKTTPPPPEVKPEKKEMIVETDPVEKPDKPVDEPPPAPMATTSLKGKGGDASIGSSGTANPFSGLGKKGGSQFGWYAGPVQSRVADALRNNKATRSMTLDGILARIWVDSNGSISRVELRGGTGQSAQSDAVREALLGLKLSEPPPADMPMPINLRLNARAGFTAQR